MDYETEIIDGLVVNASTIKTKDTRTLHFLKRWTLTMSELRLCKDCKYYRKDFYAHFVGVYNLDRCSNPVVTNDFVNGKESTYCSIARDGARCGKEGNLWESRK